MFKDDNKRTTISISPYTKKMLIKIKGRLEEKTGSSCNMDIVINYLLKKDEEKK
jgi:hypothetical protein